MSSCSFFGVCRTFVYAVILINIIVKQTKGHCTIFGLKKKQLENFGKAVEKTRRRPWYIFKIYRSYTPSYG